MRRYFYLITENERYPDRVGGVSIEDMRRARAKKNEERVAQKRDLETMETWEERYASLGHHDFEDEDDYEENAVAVMKEKLAEIDESHLRKVGIDPDEFFDDQEVPA